MSKIYKYGFYIFVLCSLFFFNIWNISRLRFNDKAQIERSKNEKRIESLQKSNIVFDREIPEIYGNEITTGKKNKIISNYSSYLIVLLSDFDCSKCQENELKEVYDIKGSLIKYGIKVLCITKREQASRIFVQMRNLNISMPLFYISDEDFAELSFDIKYPQIELINRGFIASAFLPIVQDYEFSSTYYKELIARITVEYK